MTRILLRSKRPLRVHPNPFAAPLDQHGRPSAFVRRDPLVPGARTYIGAKRQDNLVNTERRGVPKRRDHLQAPRYEVIISYDLTRAVAVADTDYHRRLLASGEIFPADGDTAKRGGCEFVPLAVRLPPLAAAALAEFTAQTGETPDVAAWATTHNLPSYCCPAVPKDSAEAEDGAELPAEDDDVAPESELQTGDAPVTR